MVKSRDIEGIKHAVSPSGKSQFTPPSISLPKGGGAIRGIGEKFAANPVTGTGSMTVPITTSPGRSGFGPQLSLSYDSGSGNGPFGFGWSLSLPQITRKTDKGLPQYNYFEESDVFILSGAEDLVPVLGDDLKPLKIPDYVVAIDDEKDKTYTIKKYRPRIEVLFARIERWTNKTDSSDVCWRSISKDNSTTWYGRSEKSRIYDPDNPDHIFSWLICQSYDDKGNAILYEYDREDSEGIDKSQAHEKNRTEKSRSANLYLKRVKYGNQTPNRDENWNAVDLECPDTPDDWMFEVVLDYLSQEKDGKIDGQHLTQLASDDNGQIFVENVFSAKNQTWDARKDPFSQYRAGFEIRSYRLCHRILMFHHFSKELEGVEDYPVRSTEFIYKEGETATVLTSVVQSGYRLVENGKFLKRSLPPLEFEYTNPPNADDLVQRPVCLIDKESLRNLPAGLDGSSYQWIDLDGEGLSGILTEQGDQWFYKRNISPLPHDDASGNERVDVRFATMEMVLSRPSFSISSGRAQFMDIAGDGRPDLVDMNGPVRGFFEHSEEGEWEIFRPFVSWPNVDTHDPNLRFIDLNGDGHADIVISEENVFTWYPSLAEDGFGPAKRTVKQWDEEKGPNCVFADTAQSVYLADLSGDGLSDLVRIRNGEVCYWPNLGYGRFGARVTMDNSPWFDTPDLFDQKRIRLADIDGSGTTDIIYLHRNGVRVYFNRSGNSWSKSVTLPVFPSVDNLAAIQVADLTGNGTACLVWSSPLPGNSGNRMQYIDLMNGQKPYLLVKTINNLGAETHVTYAASTKFYLQDRYKGKPWITRLPFPVHVVERMITYDRISRNHFATRYAYHHGYFDGEEREFRGFGMVEQWDTEEFGFFENNKMADDAENPDESSHVPPVLTRTWFHTGAYFQGKRISRHFENEYYREPELTKDNAGKLLLEDTELPPDLTASEEREACRALKGSMLRQEIYALDGPGTEDYPFGHPYSVTEQNFSVRCLQHKEDNRHAVFITHNRESLSYHYERNHSDPRVQHAFTLKVDDYGNVLQSAAVGYGRRKGKSTLAEADKKKLEQMLVTYTENEVTNAIDLPVTDPKYDPDNYRTPMPCETRAYEISGLTNVTDDKRFTFDKIVNYCKQATYLDYEKDTVAGRIQKRLVERIRIRYRSRKLDDLLPEREIDAMALPGETYTLAFTPGLLDMVFLRPHENQPDEELLPAADRKSILGGKKGDQGGYVEMDTPGYWWIPSGRVFYHNDADPDSPASTTNIELPDAQKNFFLPRKFVDPFDHASIVEYDTYKLLVESTVDAVGNIVNSINDYRVLQPEEITDPNGNRTKAVFDSLGMVAGSAVMGKVTENLGDKLDDTFKTDLTDQELLGFFNDPKGKAAKFLGNASTRIIYNLVNYKTTGQPVYAATLARETHFYDPLPPEGLKIQVSFSYSDGYGRENQKKMQAEPGKVVIEDAAGNKTIVDTTPNIRWVASGWTIYNNKGKPVRQYEPFFSIDHQFQFGKKVGVSPILFYDPLERVVATLHPNHTYEKVVFDAWKQITYDVNDTVTTTDNETGDPRTDADIAGFTVNYFKSQPETWKTWYQERITGLMGAQELDAAKKAAKHTDTPTVAHLDSLGRTFLTIADNGKDQDGNDQKYETHVVFDIEGNQREVIDAKGRVVMQYDYHIAGPEEKKEDDPGHCICQKSMEAGARWMLNDITGKPIRSWDSRGHNFTHTYDALRRPIEQTVQGTTADSDPLTIGNDAIVIDKIEYGEEVANTKTLNLRTRVYRHYDSAGVVTNAKLDTNGNPIASHDFKGNLLCSRRTLVKDPKIIPNWHPNFMPALESEFFEGATLYDALNRPVQSIAPHSNLAHAKRNIIQHVFNEVNLLDKINVWLQRDTEPGGLLDPSTEAPSAAGIANIEYDAKGQRMRIEYNNGALTTYHYNELTHHLDRLRTVRGNKAVSDCTPEWDPRTCVDSPDSYNKIGMNKCILQDLHYTYDPAGNITHIRDDAQQTVYFKSICVEPHNDYTYDALYRLIKATGREHLGQGLNGTPKPPTPPDALNTAHIHFPHPGNGQAMGQYTEEYSYDEVGNFEKMYHLSGESNLSWTRTYKYYENSLIGPGKSNRLSSTKVNNEPTEYYTHDAHGNMTMPHLTIMKWNYHDQLHATAQQVNNNGTPETAYYVYDSTGERVRKVTENSTAGSNATRKCERIYLGGFEIYRKYNGDGSSVTLERETLHVMDDKQRIVLVETRTIGTEGTKELIRYQFGNHLGSASLELDDEAMIISYEEYFPYGSSSYQAVMKDKDVPAKRYRYTGKERDEETGFNYHSARYYAPWLGRWCGADPIGIIPGLDLYAYSQSNPSKFVDPDGNQPEDYLVSPPIEKQWIQDQKSQITTIEAGTIFVPRDVSQYYPPVIGYKKLGRPYGVDRVRGAKEPHHGTDIEGEKVQAMISGTVALVHRKVKVQLSKKEKEYLWQWQNPNDKGWRFDTTSTMYNKLMAKGWTSSKLYQRVKEASIKEYEVYVISQEGLRHSYHHLKTLDSSIRPNASLTGGKSFIGELAILGTKHLHIQIYLGEYFNPKLTYDPSPFIRALYEPKLMQNLLRGAERIMDIQDEVVEVFRKYK